jgi:hypothetical protein
LSPENYFSGSNVQQIVAQLNVIEQTNPNILQKAYQTINEQSNEKLAFVDEQYLQFTGQQEEESEDEASTAPATPRQEGEQELQPTPVEGEQLAEPVVEPPKLDLSTLTLVFKAKNGTSFATILTLQNYIHFLLIL